MHDITDIYDLDEQVNELITLENTTTTIQAAVRGYLARKNYPKELLKKYINEYSNQLYNYELAFLLNCVDTPQLNYHGKLVQDSALIVALEAKLPVPIIELLLQLGANPNENDIYQAISALQ